MRAPPSDGSHRVSRRDTYELELTRDGDGLVTLVTLRALQADGLSRELRVTGSRLSMVVEPLRNIASPAGVTGRQWSGSRPIELDRRTGEHIELLLAATKPLRRHDRVALVAGGVASMGREEASYWHAKSARRGGLTALRILLLEGGR